MQTLVCLPLLCPARGAAGAAADVVGALTLGFAQPPNAAVLRQALLVAHVLAVEQRLALRGYAGLVSDMLLPQRLHRGAGAGPSSPSFSSSDSELEGLPTDWSWGSGDDSDGAAGGAASEAEDADGVPRRRRRGGGGGGGGGGGAAQHPLTLQFRAREVEGQFARYQARCLQRMDGLAYLFVLFLFRCARAAWAWVLGAAGRGGR